MLESIESPAQLKGMSLRELRELAAQIREKLLKTVSQTGGHLASNLGMVELTIALHVVYNCPSDKLVFDVGHQSYAHKLLTGRYARFDTLRKAGGISGFPRIEESPYDAYTTGHASTSLSAALGMARARDLMGGDHSVVAVVGDGALTGGMCYEALNDAGEAGTPMVVVLNDNEMSISPNVGALSGHLTTLRQSNPYRQIKHVISVGLDKMPGVGRPLLRSMERMRDSLKSLVVDDRFFGALGFEYQGPIDGHDIKRLIRVLRRAKAAGRPVLIHVVTRKGSGYEPAEDSPDLFHGVPPFALENGKIGKKPGARNGQVMAAELAAIADSDIRITAITAAMPSGTGLSIFQQRHPDRFFDVGIAEEHAITMAAGLAVSGMRPFVAIYSTFLQRAYDQVLIDVCLQKLPVTLLIDRAGLVGPDGATHQGAFDMAFLRPMPGLIVCSPRDVRDLRRMIRMSLECGGPVAIRYAQEAEDMGPYMQECLPLAVGKWELLHEGEDVMMLAVGRMVEIALGAAIKLVGKGVRCGVIDARFIKPMDEEMLRGAAQHPLLVTLEDGVVMGGFGSAVLEKLAEWGVHTDVVTLGIPDRFIEQDTAAGQMADCGLTTQQIVETVLSRVRNRKEVPGRAV
jgi:1-deoxy-D-xylulose-5-phosphate synthase